MRFFSVAQAKVATREYHFESIKATEQNCARELNIIQKSAYKKWFEDWQKRWLVRTAASNREYFEEINFDD